MIEQIQQGIDWLQQDPKTYSIACLALLLFISWIANLIVKFTLIRGFYPIVHLVFDKSELSNKRVVARLANVVPIIMIIWGIDLIPALPPKFVLFVENIGHALIILTVALAVASACDVFNLVWQKRPDAKIRPIKGYIQVAKLVIYVVAIVLIIAALVDKSPVILLSGLGAMAAVLLLVFQDTILSLVASIQISSNDMVRVGDWIEIPQLNANGLVIDLALHTVTVKNWDMTISNIPTKRFITDSFKNYRGMWDEGGRRIARSIFVDQTSLHTLSKEEHDKLSKQLPFDLNTLTIDVVDDGVDQGITNLTVYREYARYYLRHHPQIRQDLHLMVRSMSPTENGLPVEFYCFTTTTVLHEYEQIQSDLIDHMITILPEFGLRVFQSPTGQDIWRLQKQPM